MGKQTKRRGAGSRTSAKPGRPVARAGRRTADRSLVWLSAAAVAIVLVVVAVAVWASRSPSGTPAAGGHAGMEHVHGLGVNPADGTLHVATHRGVFRVTDGGATRVGQGQQDTMGFTVIGDNHFLGSGHPAPESGGPGHLGLIESTDGGVTWQTLSLEGEADFHALRYRHDTVYGFNSTSGTLLVSPDKKSWDDRGQVTLRDFVVSPSDRDVLVASGERGVMRSTDGGRTWKAGAGKPVLLLDWPTADRLWALGLNGEVMRSGDGGDTWSDLGAVDGVATAFAVHETTLYVATQDGAIQRSTDEGKTWHTLYP